MLHTILRLLAPITPFITEYLWQSMYAAPGGRSIHLEMLPGSTPAPGGPDGADTSGGDDITAATKAITEFNSMVWNRKKSENLSLKDGIALEIPDALKPFERDLRAMHNITNGG